MQSRKINLNVEAENAKYAIKLGQKMVKFWTPKNCKYLEPKNAKHVICGNEYNKMA